MAPTMDITADQINCLVYAYLQDSGFQHTSYSLRSESRLDLSPYAKTPIRRGELVDLLTKALLYTEVETHWKLGSSTMDCSASFSLIVPHKCDTQLSHETLTSDLTFQPRPELFPPETSVHDIDIQPLTTNKPKAPAEDVIDMRMESMDQNSGVDDIQTYAEENSDPVIASSLSNGTSLGAEYTEQGMMDSDQRMFEYSLASPKHFRGAVVLWKAHDGQALPLAWNPVIPTLLATGSNDSTARIWSWNNIKENLQTSEVQNCNSDFSHPDAIILRHQPKSNQQDITSLDWNVDGSLLATGSYDRLLRIWRRTGELYMTKIHHSDQIISVKFCMSGQWLLSASSEGTACIWDVASKQLQTELKLPNGCSDVDWLNNSTFAVSSTSAIHLISLSSNRALMTFIGHTAEINQVKFNKQGTMLASCSDDCTARVWCGEAGRSVNNFLAFGDNGESKTETVLKHTAKMVLYGHSKSVHEIRWCPCEDNSTEKLLATCSFDGSARVWDASRQTCLQVFSSTAKPISSITFSPEGLFLVAGCEDGYLYIYNAQTGSQIWKWREASVVGSIVDVNWQTIGDNYLALSTESGTVGIVDITKLQEIALPP